MNTLKLKFSRYCLYSAIAAFLISGCSSPKKLGKNLDKMKFSSTPEVMEVNADTILVTVKGKIPPKTFAKKAVVKFEPVLKYGPNLEYERVMPTLYLQGEKVKSKNKEAKTIKFKKGGTFTYTRKIEFTDTMKKSRLSMDYQVKIASKYDELSQCVVGKRDSTTRGTIVTSLTVKPLEGQLAFYKGDDKTPENPNDIPASRQVKDKISSKPDMIFFYVINETNLRDSVRRGGAARKLTSMFTKKAAPKPAKGKPAPMIDETPIPDVKSVEFRSYASPDGEYRFNTELVQGRAASAATYVTKELKRMGVKEVYDKDVIKKPDANSEDWAGMKKLVTEDKKLTAGQKDELLNIINSNQTPEQKEAALRALPLPVWGPRSTGYVPKTLMPRLRRTEVFFITSGTKTKTNTEALPPRPVEELQKDYQAGADSNLSRMEMLILAAGTEDMETRMKIYKAYTDRYPGDAVGQNNYAASILRMGAEKVRDYRTALHSNSEIDQAHDMLEKLSAQYPKNDTIKANLAVAKRLRRKYDNARDLLNQVENSPAPQHLDVSYQDALLNIKLGNYEKATSLFKPTDYDYNVGLAYLLTNKSENYQKTIDIVNKAINDPNAKDNRGRKYELYYLRAIAYARLNDKTNSTASLTQAIKSGKDFNLEEDVRSMAKSDLEFRKFFNTPEFETATR